MTQALTFYSIRRATGPYGAQMRLMIRVTDLRLRNTGDLFRLIK